MTVNSDTCVRLRGIGKSFSGVSVLRDVNLDIAVGEIHGLVGENGAGKSTLGKIIGGHYAYDTGRMHVFGSPAENWTPPQALSKGVVTMHQELQLVPELTVAQNVFLGMERNRFSVLANDENERLASILERTGLQVDGRARVSSLSIADRQKIEILRAIARDARVIVMDEPTSSLAADEIQRLHETMLNLRRNGRTVIYVSHYLDNILEVSDRVTVLRDGDLVATRPSAGTTRQDLVSEMLGGSRDTTIHSLRPPEPDRDVTQLEVRSLSSPNGTTNVSLRVGRGEIVGLVGLVGSGRSEIVRAIVGADAATEGTVLVRGKQYRRRSPARSTALGMVLMPEDRRNQGLVLAMPVRSNLTLPHLARFSGLFGRIRNRSERRESRRTIDLFDVKPRQIDGDIATYSGGNQQKVLLGKWLLRNPSIVILDEPSRGVDVGARRRIHEAIGELSKNGASVLLISSELEEALGLAHRAYLVSGGTVVGEIDPAAEPVDKVLQALFEIRAASKSGAPQHAGALQ